MKKLFLLFFLSFVSIMLFGCYRYHTPATYIETVEPGWKVIDIREGLRFEEAWQLTVDRIRKKYDIEIMDKDSGYLRTNWIFTTTGTPRSDYKTRVTVKFSMDKRQLELKADAMFHKIGYGFITGRVMYDQGWVPGTDMQLADDVYGDISGLLGRVRR